MANGFLGNTALQLQPFTAAPIQPTPQQLQQIEGLYRSVLGRASDPGGLATHAGSLASGTPLSEIQRIMSASPEASAQQVFQRQLGRRATIPELHNLSGLTPGGADIVDIRQQVQQTPEFTQRFATAAPGAGTGAPTTPFNIESPLTGQIGLEQSIGTSTDAALEALRTGGVGQRADLFAGLGGATTALRRGGRQSRAAIDQGLTGGVENLTQARAGFNQSINQGLTGGVENLTQARAGFAPFAETGDQAQQIVAALTGALGPDAQRAALANLEPVNEFLQERGERAVLRNAAAIGGLGGGAVQEELVRFGQGLAEQSRQQQLQDLAGVSQQGFVARSALADLFGQEAGLRETAAGRTGAALAELFGQEAGLRETAAGRFGETELTTGSRLADAFGTTGTLLSGQRQAQGRDIAELLSGAGSEIGRARLGTGASLAQAISQQGRDLANLQSGLGSAEAADLSNLANILANLAVQQGTTLAARPSPGEQLTPTPNIVSSIGQLLSGAGAGSRQVAAAPA